ncbi:hypothetical protein T484DRAFT_1757030 [Baffinella frigidus]|nr:hypothetical protein T484DRAFT_1757030 [Cryptophyta sp. CCMP2293]
MPAQRVLDGQIMQPHPPAGGPPGQGPPPTYPTILPADFNPAMERYTFGVDRERQAWRTMTDNAYMIPSPTILDFHEWDANLIARMCRTGWDEYRITINRVLYPN